MIAITWQLGRAAVVDFLSARIATSSAVVLTYFRSLGVVDLYRRAAQILRERVGSRAEEGLERRFFRLASCAILCLLWDDLYYAYYGMILGWNVLVAQASK